MQTKRASLVEQLCNIGSGFIIAMLLWAYIVTPYLGIEYHPGEAMNVTILFTFVSIVRSYIWRRIGNYFVVLGGKS